MNSDCSLSASRHVFVIFVGCRSHSFALPDAVEFVGFSDKNGKFLAKDFMDNELEKCFAFILELEKLKAVQRKVKPLGLDRYENSAEHSWQLAMAAMVLAKFSNQPVNVEKVVKILLVHDIGEIDADDAFFFDDAGRNDAKAKELVAMERIFGILPGEKGTEFFALWNEFENGDTPEAKFARAIDRAMPVLQNLYNNKQSWLENNVTKEQILSKTAYIGDGSEKIWESIADKINAAFE